MPYMRPCSNCPHRKIDGVPCQIKQKKLEIIRAARLALVNFKCDKRLSGLQPGQRVQLEMEMTHSIREGDEPGMAQYNGIVMRPQKNRVLVWLDRLSPYGKNPVPLHPNRVLPIPAPLVKICPDCGQPAGTQAREWTCWRPLCLNNENRVESYMAAKADG